MKMKKSILEHTTYFTIITPYGGFTDKMLQFSSFYKLGLSLGYVYLHTTFRCKRTSPIYETTYYTEKSIISEYLKKYLYPKITFEVFDFVGFNKYFNSTTSCLCSQNVKTVDVELDGLELRANKINTCNELQRYVKACVPVNSKGYKIVVRFKLKRFGHRGFFKLIHDKYPDFQDQLNLRSIYFETQNKHPRRSRFNNNKIKMLVHIRKGDTAVIETPWGTVIPIWKNLQEFFLKECNFSDILNIHKLLEVNAYYIFLKKIVSYFDDETFSILVFSDGYKRAFTILKKHINFTKLTPNKTKALLRMRWKSYDKRKFGIFNKIKDCITVIGENHKKMRDLIHSSLTADVIVIGPTQKMLPKLILNYCDRSNTPIVIALYKKIKPSYKEIGLGYREEKFIYIDIDNPDFNHVVHKLKEMRPMCQA